MNKRNLGIALFVVGAALVIISILADTLGIGGQSGFGWKQTIGVVVGAVILIAGLGEISKKEPAGEEPADGTPEP